MIEKPDPKADQQRRQSEVAFTELMQNVEIDDATAQKIKERAERYAKELAEEQARSGIIDDDDE